MNARRKLFECGSIAFAPLGYSATARAAKKKLAMELTVSPGFSEGIK
jgi:hypothetical protein